LSFILIDGDGVHRDGLLVVSGAIAWADDDEMGGIVYRPVGDGATIQWLPAGADQPIETGFLHGLVGTTPTGPVIVTFHDPPVGEECGGIVSDFVYEAVNGHPLDRATGIGLPDLITCNAEGADSGHVTVSYRNGHLLQVLIEGAAWMYNDREFVLLDPGGHHVALPASAFGGETAWWEQQRELDGVLSPDAALIAVRQRLDNRYSNGPDPETGEVDVEEWERLTAAIPSTIRVVDLATGTIGYETQVLYGVELGDFDGRHLALVDHSQSTIVDTLGATAPRTLPGVVVFTQPSADSQPAAVPAATPPTVSQGDAGPWVSHLQLRLLVHDPAAGLAVDGQFGPATLTAVTAFQRSLGLVPDGIVGPNTWAALLNAPDQQPSTPDDQIAILRAGGIATVDVGTPADEALTTLTTLLGAPTRNVAVDLTRECVEGSDWTDCTSVWVVATGRVISWDNLGLDVLFTDRDPDSPTVATSLRFGGWRLRAGAGFGATLTTIDGLRIGSLLGDVRRAHPDVELYLNEGVYDTFTVDPDGRLAGYLGLTWSEQVQTVQDALVARGAALAVDGQFGPATQAAWDAFVATQGLTGQTGFPSITVLAALSITFDDVPVTELWSA
jgi:peptidoglycan hydrolase-like protein with peptidoglycan-binding domain